MTDLVAIDLETGGHVPGVHAVLSIGAVTAGGSEFHKYVLPGSLLVEPDAAAVNGYTPELWAARGAIPLEEAVTLFAQWVDYVIERECAWRPLAHNAGYDSSFIDWMRQRLRIGLGLKRRWECSMATMSACQRAGLVDFDGGVSLDDLCRVSGAVRQIPHNALEDAKASLHGYCWLIDVMGRRGA